MNVIITGATSFIGVQLVKELLKRECTIQAVVRPGSRNLDRLPTDTHIKIIPLEMDDYDRIPMYLDTADAFYHLAWEGARPPCRDDAAVQHKNYICAVKALRSAQAMGTAFFLGAGSQAEYGIMPGAVDENFPCAPLTEYGKAKNHAFHTLHDMADRFSMRFVWLRIFSVYGIYDHPGTLIMSSIEKMMKNEPMQMTLCDQRWDYIYIEDVAEAMVRMLDIPCESGVYNMASGSPRPLKEFVEELRSLLNSNSRIDYGAVPYAADGPVNLEPSVSKIRNALQWYAKTPFQEGIRMMLASWQE